jgi:hypothetical protein
VSGRIRLVLAVATGLAVVGYAGHLGGAIGEALQRKAGGASALAAGVSGAPTAGDAFNPELGLPATDVVAFGSSQETPEEGWAYGKLGDVPIDAGGQSYREQYALLEHTQAAGWQVMPLPSGPEGESLGASAAGGPVIYGALAGQATAAGDVALLAGKGFVVRDPGDEPRVVPAPETMGSGAGHDEVLAPEESLLPKQASAGSVTIPYAVIEEGETDAAGLLVAPYQDGGNPSGAPSSPPGVLHYDGGGWHREPIELPSEDEQDFTALALACGGTPANADASAPLNCWLLASADVTSDGATATSLLLFRRVASTDTTGYKWVPQSVRNWLLGNGALPSGVTSKEVAPLEQGAQMLTATAQGVWVDFDARLNGERSPVDVSELVEAGSSPANVVGTWCYPVGLACSPEHSLGAALPKAYRSFAWSGSPGSAGVRIVTGLAHRAMLELAETGGSFSYVVGAGGEVGSAPGGAAFSAPTQGSSAVQGWIADGADPTEGADGEGQSQVIEVDPRPDGDELQEEAVPFRRPLLAVTQAPGSTPGDPEAEALAVGLEGQIARYVPGAGWRPEALYDVAGQVQRPTLRGVAWPETGRAYAVGDNGAMWLWRSETGLWERDPAKPFNFDGNLTAVAFSPANPQLGYAVGKQGVMLRYGKSWEQMPLPPDLAQVNFTSIAFAGSAALATYRTLETEPDGTVVETGGVAVENGAGWEIDSGAQSLLEQLPSPRERVLSKIAGLLDGGVVAAGPGFVIERDSPGSAWHFSTQPLPEAQNISALAAYREGSSGPVRAVVSVDLDRALNPLNSDSNLGSGGGGPYSGDFPAPTGSNQPPPFIPPDPLPDSGYLLKETANGWSDMEHEALPARSMQPGDLPIRPDPVLALLVDPTGSVGLAVGGQTGNATGTGPEPSYETGAAMRFPAAASSENGATPAPVELPAGEASFVLAGQSACAQPCADFANENLGPDVWLEHALQSANAIAARARGAVRAFLYAGERFQNGLGLESEAFERELARYSALLGSGGGALPVYAADSPDVAPAAIGSSSFSRLLAPYVPGGGSAYYSFLSTGSGGSVRVLVLDYASGTLGPVQEGWLRSELRAAAAASTPAVVLGNASLGFSLPGQDAGANEAGDAAAVAKILVQEGASAYFFDYPGSNVAARVSYGASSIPAYGTGTLGYVAPPNQFETDSLGASGILLASVDVTARNRNTNVAPVTAEIVPNIAQLALDATDGVLLRRSQVALFEALARRPLAGEEALGSSASGGEIFAPDPYDQIPFNCQGPNCADEIPTEYTFTSSNPDIGDFVAHEAASNNPREVQLGPNKLPIPDSHSGLFCAFNEGITTVSITTGGLTYSEPVTIQGGSVEYPCGTVPLKNPPARQAPVTSAIPLPNLASSNPPPTHPAVQTVPPPPPPVAVVPKPPPPARHHPPAPAPFMFLPLAPATLSAQPAIVSPISPPVARPIPPSGTAQVFESMSVPQREREREAAGELASSEFSAYDPNERGALGPALVPLLVLAAAAGVGIRRRTRRGRGVPALARARVESNARVAWHRRR